MRTWLEIQKSVFTRWANYHLEDRNLFVNDLFIDMRDGVFMVNLVEILSEGKRIRHYADPINVAECKANVDLILDFLRKDERLIFDLSPADIVRGDPASTLSLVWMLIHTYKLGRGWNVWVELMEWVRRR